MTNDPKHPDTRLAQALHYIHPEHGGVVPGIEPSSTFARGPDYAPMGRQIYARDGSPTTDQAEAVVASVEGAEAAMLFNSGQSAIVAVFETLRTGDHVAAPEVMYHGGASWLRRMAALRGIDVTFFDATVRGALEEAIRPGHTRILWVESPTNPNWDVIDIAAAADAAHGAGAILVADCTVSPPVTTQALSLGADIVFHSATKYLNGHSDITAGVIATRRTDAAWEEMRLVRTLQGTALPAFEAWLLIRGMRTLPVRFRRASETALAIARHFEGHPKVERVLYPGLPSHPGHAVAARQMTEGFGGMLSILVKGGEEAARRAATRCAVFLPATSLGGVESLIEHRIAVEPPESRVAPNLLRLSIGMEDPGDLIADLEQALA
ncbi:MAG: trans-sulfuration enzyme family protein [Rubricella sp.]